MSIPISVKTSPVVGAASLLAPKIDGAPTGILTPNMANGKLTLRCDVGFAGDEDWIEIQRRTFNSNTNTWGNWVAVPGPSEKDIEKMGPNFDVDTGEFLRELVPTGDSGGFDHGIFQHRCIVFLNVKDPNNIVEDRPEVASEYSAPGLMNVDRRAPYERASGKDIPPALISTKPWGPGTIASLTDITADGGIKFSVPDNIYPIPSGMWADKDTIDFFVSQGTNPVFTQKLGPPATAFTKTGNTVTFQPGDFSPLDGKIQIFYTLTDSLGNVSAPSTPFEMTVDLVADPVPLAPLVPLAPDATDTLINVADYLNITDVHILSYLNQQVGAGADVIELIIGAQPAITLPLTVVPLVFTNVNAALKAEYGAGPGPKTVAVKYNVLRNGKRFPSPSTSITLDLGVRGAVNPGVPGSRNTNLNPLSVNGASSTVPNVLEKIDAKQDSFATIALWTLPELPTAGQFIFVEIDGTRVLPGFAITTEIAGDLVRVPIAWSYWETAGNGPHKVNYFVASSATPDPLENLNRSPDTDVRVNGAVTTALTAPEYRYSSNTQTFGQWNCDTLLKTPVITNMPQEFEGHIFVPRDSRFVVGEPLEIEIVLTPDLRRPTVVQPTTPQRKTFQVPITASIQTSGHLFIIPFPFFTQIKIGTISVNSRSTLAGGLIGEGTAATIPFRSVTVKLYCDKTDTPATIP
ncbi:hypothetical protein [Pseudomonas sp. AMR01]|uniref:hypothetical protein n=1 Tax=Pseudomonas sp. AMR01 TaxID=3064904 RepID=UPI0035C25064